MSWVDGFQFALSDDVQMVQQMARSFAEKEVLPLAAKIDQEHYFPKELIPKMGALGFLGATAPVEYGGAGFSQVAYCLIVEELSAACASTGIIVSAHHSLCLVPVFDYGSEYQKRTFGTPLAKGESLGCFALSEPGSGSDAAGLTTTYRREGDSYVINGTKNWITNGPQAQVCVLFATSDTQLGHKGVTAFVHHLDLPGIQRGKPENKLGICGSPTCSLSYDGVRLGKENLLGEENRGFKVAMTTLNGGRTGVAAQAVGIARAALRDALSYAKVRKAFGKVIGEHQSVQNYLAEMITRLDASRYLTLSAAHLKDKGQDYARQAAMAKLFASETAMWAADKGVQIHGGYGYVKDFPAERHLRDAKITQIYEGTSEIQQQVVAARMLAE